jgi:putative transposase
VPRFFNSFMTRSQNLAPSFCSIQRPRTSLVPSALTPSATWMALVQSWRRVWPEVIPFYAFPGDVRRILYTTNSIEALNAKLRRAVRARGHFPTDEAAIKLLFLVLHRAEKEWIMPPREWTMAKAQFAILFGERFTKAQA